MNIGCIADIHGNFPALQAVFAQEQNIDFWVCAGDISGYYPFINEVCALFREMDIKTVRGNHDCYLLNQLQAEGAKKKAYRTDWLREQIHPGNLQWLSSLPVEMSFKWNKNTLRVRHASPWDEETYLYPDSTKRLESIRLSNNETLLLGHTHHPMIKHCGKGIVLNPGSVGQPRDWNPQASYAIFNTETKKIIPRRAAYDVAALQKQLRKLKWEENTISILSRFRTQL